MSVTVKHPFVSAVADSADTSLVRPSNWNADHTIIGLGTAAEKDVGVANGVASLDSGGKVPVSELPAAVLGALSYQGTWNASTNTPTLASGVGTKGYYYVVSVAGTTNLDGVTDWLVGDWAVYNGTAWQKVDNTDAVTSVNGQTGAVVLTTTNVAEGTNEYFTTARARASVSAGTGITYDSGTGVITNAAPDQTVILTAGTGISTSGTYPSFTITNTSPSLGGDVVGPASATDNAVARYDTTTGKLIQNSVVIIDDTGSVTGVNSLTAQSLTVNNNSTLGFSNTDTLDVRARILSDLEPNANNAKDIGTNGRNWRDGFFGRTLHTVNLELTGTTSFDGSQGTSGQVLTSAGTGNTPTWTTPTTGTVTSVGGTGTVNGLTLTGTVTTSGNLTLGGTLDLSSPPAIGGTTPAAGTFTNLAYTGTFTGGTGVIAIGTNQIYKDASGNVGIGTASPITQSKLTVSQDGAVTAGGLTVDQSNGASNRGGGIFLSRQADNRASIESDYFDGLKFSTKSGTGSLTEKVRISTSGSVGIGTVSPTAGGLLDVNGIAYFGTGDKVKIYSNNVLQNAGTLDVGTIGSAALNLITNNGTKATITSSGNVGIGTLSPSAKLTVSSGESRVDLVATNASGRNWNLYSGGGGNVGAGAFAIAEGGATQRFVIIGGGSSESMRIEAAGNVLVSTASAFFQLKSASTLFNISAQPGGNDFLRITANGTQRYQFNDAGAAYNTTGTWGTISDVRLKENIVEATTKLEKINQLRVVNFNLKSEPDVKQIGFIAQEVEQIFPSLVSNGEDDGEGGYYKSIKTTVLIPMLVKAIQEQQAIISAMETRLAAIEAK